VIHVCGLLKAGQHGITDLRITLRIHVLEQHANAFGFLVAM
jgi:hypothetical protein